MTATYDCIATTTLTTATTSITFSSISGNYTDLVLIFSGKYSGGASATCRLRFNGDTGSNYSQINLAANGTSSGSSTNANQTYLRLGEVYVGLTDTSEWVCIFNINNYSNTTTNKPILWRISDIGGETGFYVGQYLVNSAITSIELTAATQNWASGTTASLYGIKAE